MDSTKRRTKIIATIGPVTTSREMLKKLAEAGMNVARLNFSHGDHGEFRRIVKDLREIEAELGHAIGILADIQGPKLRVGKLAGGELELVEGADAWITTEAMEGQRIDGIATIPVAYRDFVKDVDPGHTILLDDGLLCLTVTARKEGKLLCKVVDGGMLKPNKGVNVPEASFSAAAITEKDYADILFSVEQGVDYIAMSFVRTAQEVRNLKTFLKSRNRQIEVLAKIEKVDALHNLEAIIDASDGILVARGDLAVEVGNERVPVLQKEIVRKSNVRGKTVIIATQMLMSMVDNPRPSRAEASDVANAIVDGADCLMLSNETTVGKYPLDSVRMMVKIISEMEQAVSRRQQILYDEWTLAEEGDRMGIALLQSAVRLAAIADAKALVVVTQSGRSAQLAAKCRPFTPLLAITPNLGTYRRLALPWGCESLLMEDINDAESARVFFKSVGQRLLELKRVAPGDKIVITAGLPSLAHEFTNTINVTQVD